MLIAINAEEVKGKEQMLEGEAKEQCNGETMGRTLWIIT